MGNSSFRIQKVSERKTVLLILLTFFGYFLTYLIPDARTKNVNIELHSVVYFSIALLCWLYYLTKKRVSNINIDYINFFVSINEYRLVGTVKVLKIAFIDFSYKEGVSSKAEKLATLYNRGRKVANVFQSDLDRNSFHEFIIELQKIKKHKNGN